LITTERGPADKVELQKADSVTAQSTAWQDTGKKTGAARASSDSVDGADEPCAGQARDGDRQEQNVLGKERKGKEASASQKRGFYFDLGLCESVTKR
jgi:hypothetical protein